MQAVSVFLNRCGPAARARRAVTAALVIFAFLFAGLPQALAAEPNPQALNPRTALVQSGDGVPGRRIGWYVDDALLAYKRALDEHKPMVLVFGERWCGYCGDMIAQALTCPNVNALSGQAVFAYSEASVDKGAATIANSLGIKKYPTVAILEPDPNMLRERGRMEGLYGDTEMAKLLRRLLSGGADSAKVSPMANHDADGLALSRAPMDQPCT
ncbi:thioredoxin fold domain-containing protein [Phenylobacterium sp.]|uniref:thioredoxin fold domain-containing protein n=1 Tax=Phenylobacterium sp. TaxID=1871053 RepID=UPI0035B34D7B